MSSSALLLVLASLASSPAAAAKGPDADVRHYAAFGGLSIGDVKFPGLFHFATSLYSYYFTQVDEGTWYAGLGIGFNQDFATRSYNQGFYNYFGKNGRAEYLPGVELREGNSSFSQGLVHVPIEANLVKAWHPRQRWMSWIGGGPSFHYLRMYGGSFDGGLAYDTVNEELFYWTATNKYDLNSGLRLLPGAQIVGGTEFIFGKLPRLGGEWGISAQGKLQAVKKLDMVSFGKIKYQDWHTDGSGSRGYNRTIATDAWGKAGPSNRVVSIGLTYHQ